MLVYKSKYGTGLGDYRLNETNAVERVQSIGRACSKLAEAVWKLGWLFENQRTPIGRDRVEELGHFARSAEEAAQNIKRHFDEWYGHANWAELAAQADAAYQAALSAHADGAHAPRARVAGHRYEAARDETGATRLALRRTARQQKWLGFKFSFDGKKPGRPKTLKSRDAVDRFLSEE